MRGPSLGATHGEGGGAERDGGVGRRERAGGAAAARPPPLGGARLERGSALPADRRVRGAFAALRPRFAALGRGAALLVGALARPSLTGVPWVLVASPAVVGVGPAGSPPVCPAARLGSRPVTRFNEQRREIVS